MKKPSVATLAAVFSDPAHARRILDMSHAELTATEAGVKRIYECLHPPKWVDVRMTVLNSIDPGLHGVEIMVTANGDVAYYLNTGETYTPTLIFWDGNYRVQSMGDFVEVMERRGVRFY